MTLFQEGDKGTRRSRRPGRNGVQICAYHTTVGVLKSRLGVMGLSLRNTEADFKASKASEESRLADSINSEREETETEVAQEVTSEQYLEFQRGYQAGLERTLKTLKAATFAMYLHGFREIYEHRAKHGMFASPAAWTSPFTEFMVSGSEYDHPEYWFPCSDWRFLLRAIIEGVPDHRDVIYDVTQLVNGGYYDPDDRICTIAKESLIKDYPRNEKIVVLTEGSTDARILQASLGLLHPELSDYYSFMDFASSRAAGGAGTLVQTVKAFSGSGIANRVVALFDNDTAGRDALRTLSTVTLPANVRAMTYPAIPLATRYPTLGPGRPRSLDINGLACSIELFLGRDVLAPKGKLTPIRWTGFSSSVRQYQGEILNKAELQKRFWAKEIACRRGSRKIRKADWSEMRILLENLFGAFQ